MSRLVKYIGIAIVALGVAGVVIGIAFIVEGQAKANYIKNSMRQEQVTLGDLGITGADNLTVIDTAATAQKAANTIKEHRHSIAPTYGDLVQASGGRFDPTNVKDADYAQAMNLENYLYLGVASLGLTTVTIVSGIFMLIAGVALCGTGIALIRLNRGKAAPG